MSSQGVPGITGYVYPITRDAQDWTRKLKEERLHKSYENPGGGSNTDMSPPWMKFGNGIRLSYNFGHLSCQCAAPGCHGNAFSASFPPPPDPIPPNTISADLAGLTFSNLTGVGSRYQQTFTFPSTTTLHVIFINANASVNQINTITFNDLNGTSFGVGSTYTIANPTLTPSVTRYETPGGTNTSLYSSLPSSSSYPLTSSTVITLTSTNPITTVELRFN